MTKSNTFSFLNQIENVIYSQDKFIFDYTCIMQECIKYILCSEYYVPTNINVICINIFFFICKSICRVEHISKTISMRIRT